MSYAFDPELAPWAALLPELRYDDVPAARALEAELLPGMTALRGDLPVDARDTEVPGRDGAPPVPVRLHVPRAGSAPRPALVYLHGGGFCLGSVDLADGGCARLAEGTGAVVIAVEYRRAPEHPYPAALEDAYAVLGWAAREARTLGLDPERIGVGGDSAGGGLAAALALLARDRGGPAVCFQYLGMPALDDRLTTRSMRAFTDTPGLRRRDAETFWDHYLGGPGRHGRPDVPPYAAPARAADLAGLPPAYVAVAEYDPLRDEAVRYAHRLLRAGVSAELHVFPGTFHACTVFQDAAVCRRITAETVEALRRGLRTRAHAL